MKLCFLKGCWGTRARQQGQRGKGSTQKEGTRDANQTHSRSILHQNLCSETVKTISFVLSSSFSEPDQTLFLGHLTSTSLTVADTHPTLIDVGLCEDGKDMKRIQYIKMKVPETQLTPALQIVASGYRPPSCRLLRLIHCEGPMPH